MTITSVDIIILEWVQNHRLESLDGFLDNFSLATTYVSLTFILVVGLFSRHNKSGFKNMVQVGLTLFLAGLIGYFLKNMIQRERPFYEYDTIEKLTFGGSPSFPSGHTLEAFAVATSIALIIRRRELQIPVFIWACLVGYSRMALGVHYPSDVIGGVLIGIILAFGVDFGFRKWVPPP